MGVARPNLSVIQKCGFDIIFAFDEDPKHVKKETSENDASALYWLIVIGFAKINPWTQEMIY